MALVRVDFVSESFARTVPFTAILPSEASGRPGMPKRAKKPFRTLYLLHGIIGNDTDWVTGTRIQRWAQERELAVVMPSGDNGFYVDHPGRTDQKYGEYVGRELVEFTRNLFPLSREREDTYLAGLSMGGYGALRNGLKYADTFGRIGAFSSALILDAAVASTDDAPFFLQQRSYFQSVFGDLTRLKGSDRDPEALVRARLSAGGTLPGMYIACGTEDFLLPANRAFSDFLRAQGVDFTYVETPGGHEWDFWDAQVKAFLDWLPLGRKTT